MDKRSFTASGPVFADVKDHLFTQYSEPHYDDSTGISREELIKGVDRILEEKKDIPPVKRKAELFSYVLMNSRIDVDPTDWFADHFDRAGDILYKLHERRRAEAGDTVIPGAKAIIELGRETGSFFAELDLGHVSPGWRFLLEKGIPGIMDMAQKKLKDCADERSALFYQSVITVYEAAAAFIKRLEEQAKRMAEKYPEHQDRMKKLSDCLHSIRTGPPGTFYEALQLSYIFHQLIEFEGELVRSMGSFEWNFGRFYEKDLAEGRITREDARELISFFWMKFFANTRGSGNGKNFYFGGMRDNSTVNIGPLSYLALELFYDLNQPDPKLSVKLGKDTPEEFRRLIARCLKGGRTNMVLINDDETLSAVRKRGVSFEDSFEYLLIGCYEPAIEGKETACNMCVKFNLAKPLELALFNGTDPVTGKATGIRTGTPDSFDTFEDFYHAYEVQLDHQLSLVQKAITDYESCWDVINPEPFISATFAPCLEKGRDISEYGPKYNNTGSMGGGLANAADSLISIKKAVFEEKRYTLEELCRMLKDDFAGQERERLYLKNMMPKWGNDDFEADAMAVRVAESYTSRVNGRKNGRGGIFTASMFTLDHCFELGHRTGALPDGREKGHYLAKGIGAMTGMDKGGVTAQIESVVKLDFTDIPNGSVLDIYLHPSAVDGEKGADTLLQLIDTYFGSGGYGIQFNILNADDLREAQIHPEEYRTLQVRVCGWNVYFVTLNLEQQNHFIETTMQLV